MTVSGFFCLTNLIYFCALQMTPVGWHRSDMNTPLCLVLGKRSAKASRFIHISIGLIVYTTLDFKIRILGSLFSVFDFPF